MTTEQPGAAPLEQQLTEAADRFREDLLYTAPEFHGERWGQFRARLRDIAADCEPASEPLSDDQCDRLRQMAGERGDAVTAVRVALGYAAQPHAASAEIRDAAWAALETLSGKEAGDAP